MDRKERKAKISQPKSFCHSALRTAHIVSLKSQQMWLQNIPKFLKLILSEGREGGNTPLDFPYIANSYTASQVLFLTSLLLSDFSTWSKFWVYVHSMCTFQTTFLRIRRMQVKHSPIPRLLPTFSLLPYYKQQKAMMVVWEWDCDGGLGMSETVMEAWELGCDGGLGMRLGWRTANVVKANTHIPLSKDIPTYAAILNKNTSSVYGALVPKPLPSFSPPLYPLF